MGKWIAIIGAVIISVFLYIIAHISATSIDEDMQEMLDEEQTQIVSQMLKDRREKKERKEHKHDIDESGE